MTGAVLLPASAPSPVADTPRLLDQVVCARAPSAVLVAAADATLTRFETAEESALGAVLRAAAALKRLLKASGLS